jgi:3-oxoacid CoA-transferase subunit A
MDKVVASPREAVADISDGATLAVGGFGLCGVPVALIDALLEQGARGLTTISNNCGVDDQALGVLLYAGRINRTISSFVGGNKELARLYLSGELDVELTPQGTLAERLRAGGAGIPAFYTPTGAGTLVAEGKETRTIGGRECVLEEGIVADFALVAAWKGDRLGNLVYRHSARNFNPMAATAGRVCIAEVEELVEPGQLDPDGIHTPGIFVHRVIVAPRVKRIEQRTVRSGQRPAASGQEAQSGPRPAASGQEAQSGPRPAASGQESKAGK